MARSQDEMDNLKNLQREAAELREKRKRSRSKGKPENDDGPETAEVEEEVEAAGPDESGDAELDDDSVGLVAHVDSVIQELEVLARKHPSMALVSAFTLGFFAGKLFSRR